MNTYLDDTGRRISLHITGDEQQGWSVMQTMYFPGEPGTPVKHISYPQRSRSDAEQFLTNAAGHLPATFHPA